MSGKHLKGAWRGTEEAFNRDGLQIIRPFYRDGRLIMPAAWRDEDDEDDFYECEVESGALQKNGDGSVP